MAPNKTHVRDGTIHVVDGSPYYVTDMQNWYDECCDCGLTHRVRYRIEDSNGDPIKGAKLKITCWSHDKMTKEARKHVKIIFGNRSR